MVDSLLRRNPTASLGIVLKKAVSDALDSRVLKTEDKDSYKQRAVFTNISNQLDKIRIELQRLRDEGIQMPSTVMNLDTGTSENLEKLIEQSIQTKEFFSKLPDYFKELQEAIQSKDMVVNVPEMPKMPDVVFPKVQQIEGSVKVKNQVDLAGISSKLDNIVTAVKSIYIPEYKPQKIEFPRIPEQKDPVLKEGKAILEALSAIEKSIKGLEQPEVIFPDTINVGNFPPQKIPQPVTHISINSLAGTVKTRSVTVGTTVTPLPGEVLSNRRSMIMYNNSEVIVEIGGSDMVFGEGIPVAPGTFSPPFDAGERMIVYGIVSSGTANVRVMEISDLSTGR